MDSDELDRIVQGRVDSAINQTKNEILTGMQNLISTEMKKISDSQKVFSDLQMSKIAELSSDYKFKRRSNEEQFKLNKKVLWKIEDCESNLDLAELDKAKENLAEGKFICILKITRVNLIKLDTRKKKENHCTEQNYR